MDINVLLKTDLNEFRDRKNSIFLNSRLYNVLNFNGIKTVYDLVEKPFSYYEKWKLSERNFGLGALNDLIKFVESLGLSFNYQDDKLSMEKERKYTKGELARTLMVDFIKSRREELGITIEELAQRLNVRAGTIIKIEELKFNPPVDLFFEILAELESKILIETTDDEESSELKRYIVKANDQNGLFTCVDMLTMVKCAFKKGAFNETQYFSLPLEYQYEIKLKGIDLASYMSKTTNLMAKWLIANHENIL